MDYDDQKNLYSGYQSAAFSQDVFYPSTSYPAQTQPPVNSSPATSVPSDQSPFRQNSPFIEQARVGGHRSAQQMSAIPVSQAQEPTKSVSPKELMIDEHDIDDQSTPLIQDQSNSFFSNRHASSNMPSFQSGLYNSHYPQNKAIQVPQQYPFMSRQNQQESSHRTPDFPAPLASMGATAEEGPSISPIRLHNIFNNLIQYSGPEDITFRRGLRRVGRAVC